MNEVLREEKKYLMSVTESQRLHGRLGSVMKEDAHNGMQGYQIRSLYFDTVNDCDYREKIDGMEHRRKIRLRCYHAMDDFAMLEVKQKDGVYQRKRSLKISREDAEALIMGDHSVLLHYREPFAAECYYLMSSREYRPKAIVEYRRRAYIALENNIRITFDGNITATETCFDLFSEQLVQYPVFDSSCMVLEVKYNGFLLSYIKELLALADRSERSFSKYCMARSSGLHYQM